jgi:hypothetical protein
MLVDITAVVHSNGLDLHHLPQIVNLYKICTNHPPDFQSTIINILCIRKTRGKYTCIVRPLIVPCYTHTHVSRRGPALLDWFPAPTPLTMLTIMLCSLVTPVLCSSVGCGLVCLVYFAMPRSDY